MSTTRDVESTFRALMILLAPVLPLSAGGTDAMQPVGCSSPVPDTTLVFNADGSNRANLTTGALHAPTWRL